ncbi:MAG: tungstate ABC transporter ATP-binding protein WtpC [Chloroflexota bacterium]|nr:tungstate ABC transporter ATP-binding protein WtpC [Chloroflexota bacterium]
MTNTGKIQIHNLCVDLGKFHLREIDLEVAAGEYFVILGPTGAGKTILLETIAGLYQADQGQILIEDQDVTSLPPEKRKIGFVYQDYALFPHLSVADNIAFGLKLRGVSHAAINEQVETMSEMLHINHLLHRNPRTLSGGEQQRVALARALVVEPRLLLLDEPLSALDPETRQRLQQELANVHQKLGTTTLHVTHDFEEAVALGDRIAVVHEGQIVQVGTPENVFQRPASPFVARFVGTRNIFQGHIQGTDGDGYKEIAVGQIHLAVVTEHEGAVHVSIRPEDIILSQDVLHSSARNCFQGRIIDIADRGTIIYVTLRVPPDAQEDTATDFVCVITRRSLEEMNVQEGKRFYLAFKAAAVNVF